MRELVSFSGVRRSDELEIRYLDYLLGRRPLGRRLGVYEHAVLALSQTPHGFRLSHLIFRRLHESQAGPGAQSRFCCPLSTEESLNVSILITLVSLGGET